MAVITIDSVETIKNRPYTINLKGFLGQSKFDADLEGVNLNIKSVNTLSKEEEQRLEKELRILFPVPIMSGGKFKKRDINKVLKQHNGIIQIVV